MSGVSPKGPLYRFGPFELNTGEESLARHGTRVKVQDLPYRLLVMLLERPGEIVTREEALPPVSVVLRGFLTSLPLSWFGEASTLRR